MIVCYSKNRREFTRAHPLEAQGPDVAWDVDGFLGYPNVYFTWLPRPSLCIWEMLLAPASSHSPTAVSLRQWMTLLCPALGWHVLIYPLENRRPQGQPQLAHIRVPIGTNCKCIWDAEVVTKYLKPHDHLIDPPTHLPYTHDGKTKKP